MLHRSSDWTGRLGINVPQDTGQAIEISREEVLKRIALRQLQLAISKLCKFAWEQRYLTDQPAFEARQAAYAQTAQLDNPSIFYQIKDLVFDQYIPAIEGIDRREIEYIEQVSIQTNSIDLNTGDVIENSLDATVSASRIESLKNLN